MRVIKFRGWDGKKMHGSESIVIQGDEWFEGYRHFEDGEGHKEGLMQYTGLKDKNGKEIFEGDVVRFQMDDACGGDDILVQAVTWSDGHTTGWHPFSQVNYDGNSFVRLETCEVIGNVHENPELMK